MEFKLPNMLQTVPAAVQTFPVAWQRTNSRQRWIILALILCVAAAIAWHFIMRPAPKAPAPPAPPVQVATAQQKDIVVAEHTIGTVLAASTVQVTSQVVGQVLSADFVEGQIVHKGDVIFRIDPKPFIAALEQAKAAYARDSATLISAEHDKVRYTMLAAQGAASAQQRDQAVAAADADAATVKLDKAAVDAAQLNLDYTVIRSPIDGKTGPVLVYAGNVVSADNAASPLVTITQIQPVLVSFFLPQSDLPKLEDRMKTGKLVAAITQHDANATTVKAPVTFIGNQVQAATGTIELRATFGNTDSRLVPGQLVDVAADVSDYPDATIVPRDAVNLGPDSHFIFVVDRQGIARLRNVDLLYDDGVNDTIRGPVKPGDRVIVVGQVRATDGHPVQVVKAPTSAKTGAATK
ncbi:MAG: efflux RND transporter periplasmic adaptor subunit [Rhizomicrobium sp.]|jgi:multidrug efflux system membrane fusion protein